MTGAGLLPGDVAVRDSHPENGYDLVLASSSGDRSTERITVIDQYLYDETGALLELLAHPYTAIVSLTITEGGWGIPTSWEPDSAVGLVVGGLQARLAAGLAPYTVLSCDNLQDNGRIARECVVAAAELVEPGLGAWVRDQVSFPGSMVDRITPAPTDQSVVVAEPFRQWVIEDRFPLGRPAWERGGALLVDDVRPYELMKLRLLNAGHQALAYPALLLGHALVHDAVLDLAPLLRAWWTEARPTLEPVPGIDLDDYTATLLERFSNAQVADTVARLASFASDRVPAFVLPVVRDNLAAGRSTRTGAFVVAAWALSLELPREVVDNRELPTGEALLDDPVFDDVRDRLRTDFLRSLDDLRRDPLAAVSAAGAEQPGPR
ncbi:MAG: mannitol dehydrogenase family protein [Frankiales bacterium]|nr:mannitol dehydrogenase family protein [Frankiales bacterium]